MLTLTVPLESFAAAVRRHAPGSPVYVARFGRGVRATAALPSGPRVVANGTMAVDEATHVLAADGLEVLPGQWTSEVDDAFSGAHEAYVAAVAYQSTEDMPGLWVDAFPEVPTTVHVLRTMYEELSQTGEMSDVSFEEFLRLANANVVILSPREIEGFVAAKCGPGSAVVTPTSSPTAPTVDL